MNPNVQDDMIEIDLKDLIIYLLQKWWILLICTMVGAALTLAYTLFAVTPQYQSTTSIYILNKNDKGNLTTSDLSVSTQLTKDYAKLIKSRTALESVLESLNLTGTYKALSNKVEVSILTDTRIIEISVKDPDPELARELADEVRNQGAERIRQVMDVEAVNVVDVANLPTSPVSPNVKKNTLLGAAVGFILCAMLFVVKYLLDDSIKTAEDVEKYLGLSTLALIPIINEEEEKHHKAKKKKRRKSDYTASRYESDFQTATDDLEDVDDIAVPAGKNQTTGKEEA